MTNRFEKKDHFTIRISDRFYRFISVFIFAVIALLFYFAINSAGKTTIEGQQDALNNALTRDIVQCYSIEGRYPPSLSYLEEHYGLVYDKDIFFVDYQPIASNLYPDVTVIMKNSYYSGTEQ